MLAMRKEGGTRAQSVTRRNAKCNEHGSVTSPLRVEAYNWILAQMLLDHMLKVPVLESRTHPSGG
jgi:hypothetical protein